VNSGGIQPNRELGKSRKVGEWRKKIANGRTAKMQTGRVAILSDKWVVIIRGKRYLAKVGRGNRGGEENDQNSQGVNGGGGGLY